MIWNDIPLTWPTIGSRVLALPTYVLAAVYFASLLGTGGFIVFREWYVVSVFGRDVGEEAEEAGGERDEQLHSEKEMFVCE